MIKFLIENGANTEVQIGQGINLLDLAKLRGNQEIINFVSSEIFHIEKSASPELSGAWPSCNASNVNDVDSDGTSRIHHVVMGDDKDGMQKLIALNANIEARDMNKVTPLFLAANFNKLDILQVLIDAKADVNTADSDNNTALHYATLKNNLAVMKLLLNNKADVNAIGHFNASPLHLAAALHSNIDAAKLLVIYGANTKALDVKGYTAFDYACYKQNKELAEAVFANNDVDYDDASFEQEYNLSFLKYTVSNCMNRDVSAEELQTMIEGVGTSSKIFDDKEVQEIIGVVSNLENLDID